MNIEQARYNMIKQQLHTWDVYDQKILDLIAQVPREFFVPSQFQHLAFADTMIPLAHQQVMMTPKEEARMLQALKIQASDYVLEIGTGSGYICALLAKLASHVCSIDIFPDFTTNAQAKLEKLHIDNVSLITADAALGWKNNLPYNAIAITGALTYLPSGFRNSLAIGGRLFAIIGQPPVMTATLFTRVTADQWQEEKLFETELPLLLNAPQPASFKF